MTPRRTFGPVVLVGLLAAALTAVASAKPWAELRGSTLVPHSVAESGRSPLAGALALVLLAAWGVVLVTRGRARRGVALLGLLAAAGVLICVVTGALQLTDTLTSAVRESPHTGATVSAGRTGWLWVAGLGALLSVAATAAAVRWAPAWPTMSQKYDAPGGGPARRVEPESADSLDLWKSMDEGHDPTK
jgi:uncharacterized membrane protein (TIGR02234 family)